MFVLGTFRGVPVKKPPLLWPFFIAVVQKDILFFHTTTLNLCILYNHSTDYIQHIQQIRHYNIYSSKRAHNKVSQMLEARDWDMNRLIWSASASLYVEDLFVKRQDWSLYDKVIKRQDWSLYVEDLQKDRFDGIDCWIWRQKSLYVVGSWCSPEDLLANK